MPDWGVPLLLLIALLAFLYRAFLHTPLAPPSGMNHEDGARDFWSGDNRP